MQKANDNLGLTLVRLSVAAAAAASLCSTAWSQGAAPAAAQPMAAPTVAASASKPAPGVIPPPLPVVPSQRMTVEDLLKKDAEAAIKAAQPKKEEPAPGAVARAALPANPKPVRLPPPPPPPPPVVSDVVALESILGLKSAERDTRVVEARASGQARVQRLRPGDVIAGFRLVGIRGGCADFVSERRPAAPVQDRTDKPKKGGKAADAAAVDSTPRAPSVESLCVDDPVRMPMQMAGTGGPGQSLNALPNPALMPGQPLYNQPGFVNGLPPPTPLR